MPPSSRWPVAPEEAGPAWHEQPTQPLTHRHVADSCIPAPCTAPSEKELLPGTIFGRVQRHGLPTKDNSYAHP